MAYSDYDAYVCDLCGKPTSNRTFFLGRANWR